MNEIDNESTKQKRRRERVYCKELPELLLVFGREETDEGVFGPTKRRLKKKKPKPKGWMPHDTRFYLFIKKPLRSPYSLLSPYSPTYLGKYLLHTKYILLSIYPHTV